MSRSAVPRFPVVLRSALLLVAAASPTAASGQGLARLDAAFDRADQNGDGSLSAAETNRFAMLQKRLEGADQDGDAMISRAEFRQAMIAGAAPPKSATESLTAGTTIRAVDVDGQSRRYRVHVPKSYRPDVPAAVVIAFHGGGGNPESMVRLSGLDAKSEQAGFIVAYPYGSGRDPERSLTFNGGECCGYAERKDIDEAGFVAALLDDLEAAGSIDTGRVFATGLSNGGIVTYLVASELADRIAAIAPIGGPMMTESCDPSRPVAVMHFHGTADELAPFDGGRGKGTPGVPAFLRPTFRSVDHSIASWVAANGCNPTPVVEPLPDAADDGMRCTRSTWGGGRDGTEVVLITIENGGHTWPGQTPISNVLGESTRDISANDLMWDFFQKHARTGPRGTR